MSWINHIKEAIGIAEPGIALFKSGIGLAEKGKALLAKSDADTMALKLHIAELQQELVSSKQAYLAVYNTLLDLKRKAEQAEKFEIQAKRYALTKTDMGSMVYALRPEHTATEPSHELCATCFEDDIKSMLQPVDFNTLGCSRCSGRFLKSDGRGQAMIGSVRSRRGDFDDFI